LDLRRGWRPHLPVELLSASEFRCLQPDRIAENGMELMHNEVIRIAAGGLKGLYRVVLDEPSIERVAAVRLEGDAEGARPKGGRKKKEKTKRPRREGACSPLVGDLLWLSRRDLESLDRDHHLLRVEIDLDPIFYLPTSVGW
jgi:hypothetical protein